MSDWRLQEEYAFSEVALENHWSNVWRGAQPEAGPSESQVLAYVRQDNYAPLRNNMATRKNFPGYVPDLDLARGFDGQGFARDGSGWRALRYKPFPGTFWPTNGSTDDVFVRLPEAFRRSADEVQSELIYRANLSVIEASVAADPAAADAALRYPIEPLDERALGYDLNGDGRLSERATEIVGLPRYYFGAAHRIRVHRQVFPRGTEFLHSVRYLDPDAPGFMARRMKELRYMRKVQELDTWGIMRAYEEEHDARDRGRPPVYVGNALVGLRNDFGWQLQGFIEDAEGRLRLQTDEEHRYCMGCHSGLGVTVDQTFAFARKLPGEQGWRPQQLAGIPDAPQLGHSRGEVLTYLERVGGADEFRANTEALERFFPGGKLDQALVRELGADLERLLLPSRPRALALNRAYLSVVAQQRFDLGRDALLGKAERVHRRVENGSTRLAATGRVYVDGQLRLDWSAYPR